MLKALRDRLTASHLRAELSAGLLCLICMCGAGPAGAATGYDSLDDAAIAVKFPAQASLVAITRVGQKLFATGQHGVILFSDDSGASWRQAKVPVDLLLTGIYFSSEQEGWAAGHYGAILHSTDGGMSWTRAVDGLDVIGALTETSRRAPPGTPEAALDLRVLTAFKAVGPSKPFLSVGGCGGGVLAGGQQDLAMFTSDHGKTWQEWTSKIANPRFMNIYAVMPEGPATFLIGEQGLILKSDADCLNFQPVSGPYTATLFGGILLKPASLLVFGLDGSLFKSADDGKTWQTLSMPPDALIDSGVLLASGQVLLGTLGGRLYLSDPGIDSFSPIAVTQPFQISDMAVAPNGNVVVVGNGGVAIIDKQSIR